MKFNIFIVILLKFKNITFYLFIYLFYDIYLTIYSPHQLPFISSEKNCLCFLQLLIIVKIKKKN